MSLKDTIAEALAGYMRDRLGLDVAEVIDWEDSTEWSGGCESCAFESAVVDVWYKTSTGKKKTYRIDMGFGELISQL